MMRSFPHFAQERLPVRVLTLPPGEDPDSYAFNYGVEIFHFPWEKARPLFEVILDEIIRSQVEGVEGRVAALEQLKPYFKALTDPVERDLWIRPAAERLGVEEFALKRALMVGTTKNDSLNKLKGDRHIDLERRLIKLILTHPTVLAQVELETWLEDFENENLREIATQILICYRQQGQLDYSLLVNQMETAALRNQVCALSLAAEEFPLENLDTLVANYRNGFRQRRLKQQQQKLKQQLHQAYESQKGEEFLVIMAKLREINLQLEHLKA